MIKVTCCHQGSKLIATVLALAVGISATSGQSGRRRPGEAPPSREPAAKPAPEPRTEGAPPKLGAAPSAYLGRPVPKGGEVKDRQTDQASATNRFLLANGLTLIVRERYSYPLVSVILVAQPVWPDAWLKRVMLGRLSIRLLVYEPPAGSKESLSERWRQLGGVSEIHVRDDLAILAVSLPRENLIPTFESLATIFPALQYEAPALERQTSFLESEIKDHPEDLDRSLLPEFATGATAPGAPAADSVAVLRAIKSEEIHEFLRRTYRAARSTVAVVGAANTFATLDAVQRLTDDPPLEPEAKETKKKEGENPGAEAKPSSTAAPVQGGQSANQPVPLKILGYRSGSTASDLAYVRVCFRLGALAPPTDQSGLALLAIALAGGRASRLQRVMDEAADPVTDLSATTERLGGTLWFITAWSCDTKNIGASERVFFQQADRLRRELLSAGEFQRAQMQTEFYFRTERTAWAREAELLAESLIRSGDFRAGDQRLSQLRQWSPEQLRQLAAVVFQYPNIVVEEFRSEASPAISPEDFAARIVLMAPGIRDQQGEAVSPKAGEGWPAIEQGAPRTSERENEAVILSLQPEPVRDLSVLRGPRAYVREDRSNPVLAIGLLFQGGRLLEETATAGITELMLRSMLRGTTSRWFTNGAGGKQLYAPDIAARLEQMGGDLEIVNGSDFFGFILTTLSRNQEAAMRLLVDVVERPTFDENDVARERGRQLLDLRDSESDGATHSRQLERRALFGMHPYAIPRWGSRETINRLTLAQVKEWYQQSIARQFPLAILVGDTDGSALVSSVLTREIRRGELQKSFKATVPAPPEAMRTQAEQRPGQISYQTFGLLGAPAEGADYLGLQVISSLLTGAGGVLQSALRRQLGLHARVEVKYEVSLLPGTWEVQISHPSGGEERVRALLTSELSRLGEKGLSQAELDRAKSALLGDHLLSGMDSSGRLRQYAQAAFYGAAVQDIDSLADRMSTLTLEKLQTVLSKYLKPDRGAWGVLQGIR